MRPLIWIASNNYQEVRGMIEVFMGGENSFSFKYTKEWSWLHEHDAAHNEFYIHDQFVEAGDIVIMYSINNIKVYKAQ